MFSRTVKIRIYTNLCLYLTAPTPGWIAHVSYFGIISSQGHIHLLSLLNPIIASIYRIPERIIGFYLHRKISVIQLTRTVNHYIHIVFPIMKKHSANKFGNNGYCVYRAAGRGVARCACLLITSWTRRRMSCIHLVRSVHIDDSLFILLSCTPSSVAEHFLHAFAVFGIARYAAWTVIRNVASSGSYKYICCFWLIIRVPPFWGERL